MQTYLSQSLEDTERAGITIAPSLGWPCCVYLRGDLGAGKTYLSQAIIRCLGYEGAVTSPTYNLIQEYPVASGVIFHMDLYRLQQAQELEYLAIADLWQENSLFLVEWPDRGQGFLPAATDVIDIRFKSGAQGREISHVKIEDRAEMV